MTRRSPEIRPATDDDLVGVMRVFDAGLLETDAETVRRRTAADRPGAVLVADADGRVVGAIVLTERPAWVAEAVDARDDIGGRHVDAIAVGRSRRGQGVGTALLRAAVTSVDGDLTADFAASVRGFYESFGCRIETVDCDSESSDRPVGSRLVARVGVSHTAPAQSGDGDVDG